MKVLIATLLAHYPPAKPKHFPRATTSILSQTGRVRHDHVFICDGDEQPYAVNRKYQRARELALHNGYDALLCAESDMILPPDALDKLAAQDADVAYGLYCVRTGKHEWTAYTQLDLNRGTSLSNTPAEARAAWGRTIEVAGIGQGCTLIHRHVLERFDFRVSAGQICDHTFALDAARHGFKQVCDLSVVCGHIDTERVIWPDADQTELYRIENL